MRDRAKRFASAEEVKNAILHESSRKFWKAVLWVVVCGVAAALAAGVIIKGFEPQQNPDPSGEVQSEVAGEAQSEVSEQGQRLLETSGEEQQAAPELVPGSEISEQESDQSVISGQEEQGLPEASAQSDTESGTPEQGTGENATNLSTDFNSEPSADSSATDQPSSETAAENIDAEALEDLFKEAAGQIL